MFQQHQKYAGKQEKKILNRDCGDVLFDEVGGGRAAFIFGSNLPFFLAARLICDLFSSSEGQTLNSLLLLYCMGS